MAPGLRRGDGVHLVLKIAAGLAAIQLRHPGLTIGSYPFFAWDGGNPGHAGTAGTTVVVRGRDEADVNAASGEVEALARSFGIEPEPQRP
jgi:hypothetical protein